MKTSIYEHEKRRYLNEIRNVIMELLINKYERVEILHLNFTVLER
jgi:hypothetical protein